MLIQTKWTQEQIQIMIDYYEIEGPTKIMKRLPDKTYSSIKNKARRLNLKSRETLDVWTEREITLIKENYQKFGPEIPELLKTRTKQSIRYKAHELGLYREEFSWSKSDIELLIKYYKEEGPVKVAQRFPNKTVKIIQHKAAELGLTTKRTFISLYDFCQNNPDKLYLLEEWDYEENKKAGYTPQNTSYGSDLKYHWKCSKGHVWTDSLNHRIIGRNCPVCAGKKVLKDYNDLASQRPDIAAQWHPTKNGDLKPTDVTVGSRKKVWWQCPICGNEWSAVINSRTNGNNCPQCTLNGSSISEMALYFYLSQIYKDTVHRYKKNNVELDIYIPSINTAIEYDSGYYHADKLEKENKKDQFCKNNNIRFIRLRDKRLEKTINAEIVWFNDSGYKYVNQGIKNLFDYLEIEYKFEINIDKDYEKIINVIIIKEKENSIVNTHPEIATQWHPTKNGNLKPEKFTYGSNKLIWWLCPKGHIHQASIRNMVKYGCPECSSRVLWTEEEVDILIKYYPIEGIKVKDRLPNRTEEQIRRKVKKLKLKIIK